MAIRFGYQKKNGILNAFKWNDEVLTPPDVLNAVTLSPNEEHWGLTELEWIYPYVEKQPVKPPAYSKKDYPL